MNQISRRSFMKKSAAAGFFISASSIYGQAVKAGDQKLRVLKVGTDGMGGADINSLLNTNEVIFTGLCDTDPNRLRNATNRFKGVPGTTDYRELLEKYAKNCDAVCISTPDHTHAIIALEAMRLGKHVYVQKPLAHTFEECEMLMAAEKKYKVVTQMGNQGHPGVYRYEKLWENKFWGDITEVHSWTDRANGWWPQGMQELAKGDKKPDGYNWDCWLGPAAMRPFSWAYLPFKWRGWKDFGCGAIGDMAVHNLDPAYWVLKLGLPLRLKAWVDRPSKVAYPLYSTIDMQFGPSERCPKGIKLYWYESKILPKAAPGAHMSYGVPDNGCMVVGSRATTVGGSHAGKPQAIAATGKPFGKEAKDLQHECNNLLKGNGKWSYDHYRQWVDACKAGDQTATGSRFAYAARLTQTLLMGCVAQFFPGRTLTWDPKAKQFDLPEANAMLKNTGRPGFELRV